MRVLPKKLTAVVQQLVQQTTFLWCIVIKGVTGDKEN